MLWLLGLGGLGLLLLFARVERINATRSVVYLNDHAWYLDKIAREGIVQCFRVSAPETPVNVEFPVLEFKQTGDDPKTRVLTKRFAQAPLNVQATAMKDFSILVPKHV